MASTDRYKDPRARSLPLSGMLLVKLGRVVQRRFNDALKPSDLTPRHLQVLDEDRVGVDPTKLVGLLNDLEGKGLVVRRRDPVDRRRHIVENSRAGVARVDAALAAAAAVEDELLAALDAEQRAQLRELLVLAADATAAEQDPCG